MAEDRISLAEASRISGVSASTLKRWTRAGVVPVKGDRWTTAAAAQARVVARMRERGHSLDELRRAGREGRLAFGYMEDLLPGREKAIPRAEAANVTGLEEELIERVMTLLGTPTALQGTLSEEDLDATRSDGRPSSAPGSRSSLCSSSSASTRSRSARSPRPRCGCSTSTCTSR